MHIFWTILLTKIFWYVINICLYENIIIHFDSIYTWMLIFHSIVCFTWYYICVVCKLIKLKQTYTTLLINTRKFNWEEVPISCLRDPKLSSPDNSPPFNRSNVVRKTITMDTIATRLSPDNKISGSASELNLADISNAKLSVPRSTTMADIDYESAIYNLLSQQDPFYDRTPWFTIVGRFDIFNYFEICTGELFTLLTYCLILNLYIFKNGFIWFKH